ncbi:hypothetical protein [Sansalvadorimonas verongulae]|uniref:hypothetical protein n=1 Tax=Sansalvadorimonas verongulae TaxID=2172824 RepID=UPI0012BD355C|nr:hypothetical protein [Sansalvadorimonas verongulae]MTI12131.1 hypothetical protein [Sansalvadorimonas verongulae]
MNKEDTLSEVSKHLNPIAVLLRGGGLLVSDDAEEAISEKHLSSETFKAFTRYSTDESSPQEQGDRFRYRFEYEMGVRLVDESLSSESSDFAKVVIEAKFEAQYTSNQCFDDESLSTFGKLNAEYHIWPYWREYVQSVCQRAGIPVISIGLNRGFMKAVQKDSES